MTDTFEASSILIGTIVGAGILGIPYVIMQAGFPIGILHLILIASLMILINLYLGEIALRTKETHQLTGYAEKYIGKKGKILMMIALAFGIYSALLAYLIGEGQSLSYLIFGSAQYQIHLGLAFWVLLSFMSYFGLKTLKKGEMIGVIFVLALIILIAISFFSKIKVPNLLYYNPGSFFIPFGVILFAFLGFAAIPEMERVLGKDRIRTKKSIWTAYLIVLAIYILFTIIVLGSQGLNVPEIATIGLGKPFILLGIFTMFTAYLALSNALIDSFRFDYKKSKIKSWLYTISIPLIAYAMLQITRTASFVKVIGIGGVLSGGLTAILILAMVKQAKKHTERIPEYHIPFAPWIKWVLIVIFVAGAIGEIIYALH